MKKAVVILMLALLAVLSSCAPKADDFFKLIGQNDVNKVRNALDLNKELIKAKKDNGSTPLHEAAYHGNLEMVNLLIQRGADLNAQKSGGFTPMHVAAQKGHEEICILLIKNRAKGKIKDEMGMTPADVASQQGFKKLADKIKSATASEH